jgi:dipeptidase D
MRLKIYGLRGGHSGLDIHQGRGSAIKIIARLLWQAQNAFKFSIIRMEGGSKRNAIPREAWADFYLQRSQSHPLASFLKKALDEIRKEYAAVEKELQLSLGQSDGEKEYPLSAQSQNTLIALLLSLPHGVMAMHPEIAGLVETSTNLAIVSCQKKHAQVICNTRSSIASALEAIRGMIKAVTHLAGAKITLLEGYPGWKPNLQSPLLMALTEVHKHVFGREPQVIAVHAGLECGILGEKFPGMDMISFGPTIQHPHSPEERVHIPSVENFWKFLTAALG